MERMSCCCGLNPKKKKLKSKRKTMKKYPIFNMRKSKDVQQNLDLLIAAFGFENTDGAEPRIIRMALRSLKHRVLSLQDEFGRDFMEAFRFKARIENKNQL